MKKENSTICLPKLGESILSATVVQWFKKVGDRVEKDEALLEVSTDKVNSEIPSPVSGVLLEILAKEGQELQVGEGLATVGDSQLVVKDAPSQQVEKCVFAESLSKPISCEKTNEFLSPAVLRLLQERGISLQAVDQIPRTGADGRLTKQDVENFNFHPVPSSGERIKMNPLRKAIAENMVKSFYEAPHASLVMEVDVTPLMKKINLEKEAFFKEHGVKLTITPFIAKAIGTAAKKYPHINSSLDGDTIVMKKEVNLGIAVSIENGVMVPVVRHCESLNISQIAKKIGQLAERARNKTLSPSDVQEGSITMTNFGMAGALIGIPIIRYPEVAIIGIGTISKKVMPMEDDSIAIRSVVMLSLTFDHRVIDGIYGCEFLKEVKTLLSNVSIA